jgi:arsenate reductase
MTITIYHNPSCSKSRKTLEIIRAYGIEPQIVEYLEQPPDARTVLKLANLLVVRVADIVRKNETEYTGYEATAPDDTAQATDDAALAEWISSHPKLLQRPIVVDEERNAAVIGRPPEAVLGLLSDPAESSAGS